VQAIGAESLPSAIPEQPVDLPPASPAMALSGGRKKK
jgi:hypothetical protein